MRKIYFLSIILTVLAFASLAKAHPLGNFSVNQYTGVEVGASTVRLRQFLDLAEIPTFQELQNIDLDKNGTVSDGELDKYLQSHLADLYRKFDSNCRWTAGRTAQFEF